MISNAESISAMMCARPPGSGFATQMKAPNGSAAAIAHQRPTAKPNTKPVRGIANSTRDYIGSSGEKHEEAHTGFEPVPPP